LAERLAFKALFVERLSLSELQDYKVGNLEAAYQNVHDLAEELVETLRSV
jgi:chromosome partitioning protein